MNGASNVLGTLNDLASISKIVKKHGARFLVDAAQLVAHQKIDVQTLDIDYMAFPAHKIYAPFGCGVLLARKGTLNYSSGELEGIKSSGEENAAGIAALGKALVLLKRVGMELLQEEEKNLTKYALEKLSGVPGIKIHGINDPDSPLMERRIGVISFDLKNKFPNKIAGILSDRGGVGVRYGCHCAHVIVKHVLKVPRGLEQFQRVIQVLFPKMRFPGVMRISIGIGNTREDIDKVVSILKAISGGNEPDSSSTNGSLDKKAFQTQKKDFIKKRIENIYA
jgi:selenocysteine lyase/cysteine desulfurase